MKVLAVDPGLASTGWALVDGMTYLDSGTVHTKPGESVMDRATYTADAIMDATHPKRTNDTLHVAIEYPEVAFGGKAFKGVMENFYVAGFISGWLGVVFESVTTVNPSVWSKGYKGRMGERMESARNMAVKAFKVKKRTSEHERDALGIALWAVTGGIK